MASSDQARRGTDEEGEEVGNGRAEASSTTIGDGGQAAVSFTPDVDGRC